MHTHTHTQTCAEYLFLKRLFVDHSRPLSKLTDDLHQPLSLRQNEQTNGEWLRFLGGTVFVVEAW